jgi:hypothetical protein
MIQKELPSPVDYLKKHFEDILFSLNHYPWFDNTTALNLLEDAYKTAKLIENYNNEIKNQQQ